MVRGSSKERDTVASECDRRLPGCSCEGFLRTWKKLTRQHYVIVLFEHFLLVHESRDRRRFSEHFKRGESVSSAPNKQPSEYPDVKIGRMNLTIKFSLKEKEHELVSTLLKISVCGIVVV